MARKRLNRTPLPDYVLGLLDELEKVIGIWISQK